MEIQSIVVELLALNKESYQIYVISNVISNVIR